MTTTEMPGTVDGRRPRRVSNDRRCGFYGRTANTYCSEPSTYVVTGGCGTWRDYPCAYHLPFAIDLAVASTESDSVSVKRTSA